MPADMPIELSRLLQANDEHAQANAWEAFVRKYSRLLMHVSRSRGAGYDGAMDRYTRILDQLRSDDCRRLRTYAVQPHTQFTTWLVVVARRICMDHQRGRYGRPRISGKPDPAQEEEIAGRRRLADLIGADVDLEMLRDPSKPDAVTQLQQAEQLEALEEALRGLSNRDRLLITLRFRDGAPVREVAQVMGFPSQFHVYRQVKKVLARLKQSLERRGIDESTV